MLTEEGKAPDETNHQGRSSLKIDLENSSCHLCCEQTAEVDYQDEQHNIALDTVWRNRVDDVGSSQFPWTYYVTPHGSNPGYAHPLCPPCLCGDKGSNLG